MSKRLGESLIEAGLVSAEAVEQALGHQKITGHRLGDCLVELGLVAEPSLLRFLASELKTKFVSAEKLSKATIASTTLDKVPVRMAEAQDFLPLTWDPESRVLTILIAEPQNADLVKEIGLVSGAGEVTALVGVRSAIQAGIKKHYYGDPTAFSALAAGGALQGAVNPQRISSSWDSSDVRNGEAGRLGSGAGRGGARPGPSQLREALGAVRGTVSESDFLETITVLVGLLEAPRKEFRGHSALVARHAALIARRIGLQPREVSHTSLAASLHELGKRPDKHFTLPLLALQPDLKGEARRFLRAPVKLFESVHLPGGVNGILAQLYEAFDGSGIPQGVKGEDISAGARIIAAVDSFFDLTRNPWNPLGRLMPKSEALAWLHAQSGALFDPVVVDALTALQSGDLLRARVENDGRQVFVADPEEAVRTDLTDALSKAGLVVQTVTRLEGVVDAVLGGEADTIGVGLAFGVGDIVAMTQFIRARPESATVPVLVLGDPTDPASRERLVQAGVPGFIAASASPDDAASALRGAFLDRVEHGGVGHPVRGGFDELPPAELARLLGAARKSGRLTVRLGPGEGFLQVERGRAVFASMGDKKGEAAVSPLFAQAQADFVYDPEALLTELPNLDQDLEVLARALSSRASP